MGRVDISKIRYDVIAVLSSGAQMNLNNVAVNVAWEENETELAARLNLTLRDLKTGGASLAEQLPLGTAILLYYSDGDTSDECFRGTVWEWGNPRVNDDEITLTAYDMLYYLNKSKDYGYWEAGKSTRSIVEEILGGWSVPLGKFTGPSITHEKVMYKNKAISAMLQETMEEAKKQTGTGYIIRASKGKCEILSRGENSEIWCFTQDTNLTSASDKLTMADLITKVIVIGKDDDQGKGRPEIEQTLTGETQYGTLQEIVTRGSSTEEEAKSQAEGILKDRGKPKRSIVLRSPDFPRIRKGDKIRVILDRLDGYFLVKTVSHNATAMQMQMEVEPT